MARSVKTFAVLQARAQETHAAFMAYRAKLERKHGREWWRANSRAPERHRDEVLDRAAARAWTTFLKYLREHSPWEWESGVSCRYIREELTEAQALASEAPALPASAAAYGFVVREDGWKPARRGEEV